MKPIKLKIKGLNSFIEEQEIDFLKLTDRGLFGIFGPTGSGKSSILDGITLALYGEVARKSSNYINMNCNKANIHYEFQISGKNNKIYSVDREFKRDKKSGNPLSGKCKICDITGEEPVILAEKVKDVTNKCIEIVGLSLEDFTRTVVLPQGKFSEFLKLEGRARREMLERLFNLKKYGDDLAIKLSYEINKAKNEENVLKGQLNGYEDVSIESLKVQKDNLKELKDNYENDIKEFNDVDKKFNESKEVFMLHNELNDYEEKLSKLIEKEDSIKIKKNKIDKYTHSSKIIPAIKEYDKTLNILKTSREKEPILKIELNNTKGIREKIEDDYKKCQYEINTKVPEFKIKVKDIEEAILIKKKLSEIINEIGKYEKLKLLLENKLKEEEEKRKDISNDIEKLKISMGNKEIEIENRSVSNELKENIQKGYIVEGNINDLNERLNIINIKINDLSSKEEDLKKEFNDANVILKDKESKLNKLKSQYDNVINTKVSQEDLLKMQEELSIIREKYDKYNKYLEGIKNNKVLLNDYINKKKKLESTIDNLEKEVENLKEKKKLCEISITCNKLRKELKNGKPCPVCGSVHHEVINLKDINEDEDVKNIIDELEKKENILKKVKSESDLLTLNINSINEAVKNDEESIKDLGEDFKKHTVESLEDEFKKEVSKAKENENTKYVLEKEINVLKEEISVINNKLVKNKTQIDEGRKTILSLNNEKEELNNKLLNQQKEISNLRELTNVSNFSAKYKEININENYLEKLTGNLKSDRDNLDKFNKEFNNLNISITTLSERITNGINMIEQKESEKQEKILEIKKRVGNINDLEISRDEITNKIKEIENKFKSIENSKEEITDKYNKLNENYITLVSSINEFANRESQQKNDIDNLLLQEGFDCIEECMQYDLTKDEYNKINEEINEFNSSFLKIKGAIESINVKINNRYISKEEYENIKKYRDELSDKMKILNEEIIKKQEEVLKTEERIKELNVLINKQNKLLHKIAILNDLDKLFRGKKFVEFVAIDRLKYISKEASKRLKDITNGNYGLEVDENSKFIIRDYKNGGVKRDASTLSGGEIFLASLALALALSSEIQLKGTAPLELFFLDEGFGTLDDNLLDVVMSSLERIHNDKLKVGIISHVESIKNRVPVKLIITPAESGICGSKVKIERS